MLYVGQTHTVSVPLAGDFSGGTMKLSREVMKVAFETAYATAFGRFLENIGIRVLNLRVDAIGRRRKFDLGLLAPPEGGSLERARRATLSIWLTDAWLDDSIYSRSEDTTSELLSLMRSSYAD